jgi:uncharacterized membrane protein HdeD (DUF308 family)
MDASPLSRWENFYVIVGSSAGALTGLRRRSNMQEVRAFGSPTVVHFCAALLIAAVMSAPWNSLTSAAVALGVCAVLGGVYAVSVIRHARRQQGYQADAEDWFWYIILPIVHYVVLLVAALLLDSLTTLALFLVAATSLLLLFNGIHNSWDSVTYIALHHMDSADGDSNKRDDAA